MPYLLRHIDAIAREKQHDVLFLAFGYRDGKDDAFDNYFPESDAVRLNVMEWLTTNNIPHQPCAGFANENYMGGWRGEEYLDVPNDPQDANYKKLCDYFEKPDGTTKIPEVRFFILPLEKAMENAHHDEPLFWDKWAKSW